MAFDVPIDTLGLYALDGQYVTIPTLVKLSVLSGGTKIASMYVYVYVDSTCQPLSLLCPPSLPLTLSPLFPSISLSRSLPPFHIHVCTSGASMYMLTVPASPSHLSFPRSPSLALFFPSIYMYVPVGDIQEGKISPCSCNTLSISCNHADIRLLAY